MIHLIVVLESQKFKRSCLRLHNTSNQEMIKISLTLLAACREKEMQIAIGVAMVSSILYSWGKIFRSGTGLMGTGSELRFLRLR